MESSTLPSEIEVLQDDVVAFEWNILRRVRYRVGTTDNVHVREAVGRGDRASALVYDLQSRRVLLTRQFRLPAHLRRHSDGWQVEVCTGLVEAGETPEQCIRREILEEMGVSPVEVKLVRTLYMAPGTLTEATYLFLATTGRERRTPQQEPSEFLETLEFDIDTALQMNRDGYFSDAKTVLLLLQLELELREGAK